MRGGEDAFPLRAHSEATAAAIKLTLVAAAAGGGSAAAGLLSPLDAHRNHRDERARLVNQGSRKTDAADSPITV